MQRTPVLFAVHIGRMIKRKWFEQGKLKFRPSNAEKCLELNKIKVYRMEDLNPPRVKYKTDDKLTPVDLPLDENHPDYKVEACYIYGDGDVLLEGLDQARKFTNCIEIPELPSSLRELESAVRLPKDVHDEAERKILLSCVLDAQQEKLPRRKDPVRPQIVLPRDYGITDDRKNMLLFNNLISLCAMQSKRSDRSTMSDTFFTLPLRAYNKFIQFELTGDVILRSDKLLTPPSVPDDVEINHISDLYPVDCTVTIKPYHFYEAQNYFPISGNRLPYVHTIFVSYTPTRVSNIYEEEVTESQIMGRNLLKGFCAAGAQARALFGDNVRELEKPVVVQIIMTDGKQFHFSVLQLNSLDVENADAPQNVYWNSPLVHLYSQCEYSVGRPVLQSYNEDVLNRIMAFYENE